MTFTTMKPAELRKVVTEFVGEDEANNAKNKAELLAILTEEGVTYELYSETLEKSDPAAPEVNELPKPEKAERDPNEKDVLVKMDRPNFRFDAKGFTFTKEHPYVVMTETEAQSIFDDFDGFRIATPKEAKEYYS